MPKNSWRFLCGSAINKDGPICKSMCDAADCDEQLASSMPRSEATCLSARLTSRHTDNYTASKDEATGQTSTEHDGKLAWDRDSNGLVSCQLGELLQPRKYRAARPAHTVHSLSDMKQSIKQVEMSSMTSKDRNN